MEEGVAGSLGILMAKLIFPARLVKGPACLQTSCVEAYFKRQLTQYLGTIRSYPSNANLQSYFVIFTLNLRSVI